MERNVGLAEGAGVGVSVRVLYTSETATRSVKKSLFSFKAATNLSRSSSSLKGISTNSIGSHDGQVNSMSYSMIIWKDDDAAVNLRLVLIIVLLLIMITTLMSSDNIEDQ